MKDESETIGGDSQDYHEPNKLFDNDGLPIVPLGIATKLMAEINTSPMGLDRMVGRVIDSVTHTDPHYRTEASNLAALLIKKKLTMHEKEIMYLTLDAARSVLSASSQANAQTVLKENVDNGQTPESIEEVVAILEGRLGDQATTVTPTLATFQKVYERVHTLLKDTRRRVSVLESSRERPHVLTSKTMEGLFTDYAQRIAGKFVRGDGSPDPFVASQLGALVSMYRQVLDRLDEERELNQSLTGRLKSYIEAETIKESSLAGVPTKEYDTPIDLNCNDRYP